MNTLESPGPYDPLSRTAPDEPFFPVVAHDRIGPATVRFWSDKTREWVMAEIMGLPPADPALAKLEDKLRQCTEADLLAMEMERWVKGNPETDVAPTRARCSGGTIDADKMDDAARKLAVAEGVQCGREAAFYASEMRDKLAPLGTLAPDEIVALEEAMRLINSVSDAHTVRRPGFQPALPMASADQ